MVGTRREYPAELRPTPAVGGGCERAPFGYRGRVGSPDVLDATHHYPDGDIPDAADLIDSLADAVEAVEQAGLDYVLMGGIGSFALARPRETHDIDLFVRPGDLDAVFAALHDAGFVTRMHDSSWLAKAFKRGVLVDLIFRSAGDIYLDDEMLARAERCDYKGVMARVISPEDLMVIKAMATTEHTAHHWYDALALISRCQIDWSYVMRRARQAGPRRLLSLLLYAESCDLAVPSSMIAELYALLHGGDDDHRVV